MKASYLVPSFTSRIPLLANSRITTKYFPMKTRLIKIGKVTLGLLAFLFIVSNIMITPSKISYGYYCGMCDVRCSDIYTIGDKTITIDTASFRAAYYTNNKVKLKPDLSIPLNPWDHQELTFKIPLVMLLDPIGPWGCPDCSDQCGIYLDTTVWGLRRTYKIDPNRSPWYYKGLTNELRYLMEKVRSQL